MSSKWRDEIRARVRAGDPEALALVPHGLTGHGYGCKCEICMAARHAYDAARRRSKGIPPRRERSDDEKFRALRLAQREGLRAASKSIGVLPPQICDWRREAALHVKEALGLLAEIDQIRNGMQGRHCVVDGVPLPTGRRSACSPRCSEIWQVCRYQLVPDQRDAQTVRNALWTIEHSDDEAQVRHARRVVQGAELTHHGRWANSEKVRSMLAETMERRAAARDHWGDLAAVLPTPVVLAEQEASRP